MVSRAGSLRPALAADDLAYSRALIDPLQDTSTTDRATILAALFGDTAMPEGGGFYLFLSPRAQLQNQLEITLNTRPAGHAEQGLVFAVTVQMLGLYFSVAFTILTSEHETLWYRPRAIDFDGRGRVDLEWQDHSSNEIVELRRTRGVR